MVNPETGEPLLQVGIAYKHLKDKMAKEKAAEADRKEKKAADMKNTISKLLSKLGLLVKILFSLLWKKSYDLYHGKKNTI